MERALAGLQGFINRSATVHKLRHWLSEAGAALAAYLPPRNRVQESPYAGGRLLSNPVRDGPLRAVPTGQSHLGGPARPAQRKKGPVPIPRTSFPCAPKYSVW